MGWFLKQNIHIAVHLHTLESGTVNFSAMCTDQQEETEGAMCKFWVCMAVFPSSLSIYPVYLSNTLKWGQPFFLNSFRAQRVILLERSLFTSSTSDAPGELSCANLHLEWWVKPPPPPRPLPPWRRGFPFSTTKPAD